MALSTKSGRIRLQEYEGFGGNSFDSIHLSRFFNYGAPHDFGVKVSRMFSSSDRFMYKPLTAKTMAVGNFVEIDGDLYRWSLIVDDYRRANIVENLESSNTRPGWGGEEFKIALNEPWYNHPDVIIIDDNRFPLQIVGSPVQVGTHYEYTVRLLSGNPNEYLDPSLLQPGNTVCKVSTAVSTEMNQDFGTMSFGTQIDLQSQIGAFADKFEVTDKIVRKEISAKKNGAKASQTTTPYTAGYVFGITDKNTGKPVPRGGFITYAEAKLLDEIEMDREWAMHFGKVSTRTDSTGKYIMRTAPGFRELVKDGHEYYYNLSITARELENYFDAYFYNRVDIPNRVVEISTGQLGMRIFDQLVNVEASAYLTSLDTSNEYFVRKEGATPGDLEFGYQWKSYRAKNGLVIKVVHDPIKNSYKYCNRRYPLNPIYTVDSARMDIYDFSSQGTSIAPNQANMSMIKEAGVDSYHWISGCVDPRTGVLNDGSMTSSGEKGVVCRREMSGSLCIWDTSRIGSLIYEPSY